MKHVAHKVAAGLFVAALGFARNAAAFEELVTPTNVGCFESGECFIVISPALASSNTSCPNRSQVRFMMSTGGGDAIFKTALAALMAGKKLIINPTNACVSGFPRPNYVHVGL